MQEFLAKVILYANGYQALCKLFQKWHADMEKGSILCVLHLGLVYISHYGDICTQKDL